MLNEWYGASGKPESNMSKALRELKQLWLSNPIVEQTVSITDEQKNKPLSQLFVHEQPQLLDQANEEVERRHYGQMKQEKAMDQVSADESQSIEGMEQSFQEITQGCGQKKNCEQKESEH